MSEQRKRGLGMGLSALLGDDLPERFESGASSGGASAADVAPQRVPLDALTASPFQPRRNFTEPDLAALAESIKAHGIMQPIVVRPRAQGGARYEIIAGERRWRAAAIAGLREVPIVVRALSDAQALELALIENLQRQDLTPIEEADAYRRLLDDFAHTQDSLARVLGKSRSHVANSLRLLNLPDEIKAMVEMNRLSAGHARALLAADDMLHLANLVVTRGLNVRQTEALVRKAAEGPGQTASPSQPPAADSDYTAIADGLAAHLSVKVALRPKTRGQGGTLTLAYDSSAQLDAILERLQR